MRHIERLPLSPKTQQFLLDRTRSVGAAADPRKEAKRLWGWRANRAFDEIREALSRMASGIQRCMYCEDNKGTDIDHFWPKAPYPERAFEWANYLLGCSCCNSNHKRDQFPLDSAGQPLLLNPTEDEPLDHLAFITTGEWNPLSTRGEISRDVFGLNRPELILGRRREWLNFKYLLIRYGQVKSAGLEAEAQEVVEVVRSLPFAGVITAFFQIAEGPDAKILVGEECLQILQKHPEIATWV